MVYFPWNWNAHINCLCPCWFSPHGGPLYSVNGWAKNCIGIVVILHHDRTAMKYCVAYLLFLLKQPLQFRGAELP